MINLIWITVLTGVCGLLLGAVCGILWGAASQKQEALLLNFSAGAMIALVCFEFLHEAQETGVSIWLIAATALAGAAIVTVLDYWVDQRAGHKKKHGSRMQLFVAGLVMAAAVAIHNIPEGMSIGAIYANGSGRVNPALLTLLVSIVLHNIPEGMAIALSLVTGGMPRAKACAVAALSGVPTVFGALLGYLLGDMGEIGLSLSLSFAAGTLLYVVFGEIMPQAVGMYRSRKTAFAAIVGLLCGMLILTLHVH